MTNINVRCLSHVTLKVINFYLSLSIAKVIILQFQSYIGSWLHHSLEWVVLSDHLINCKLLGPVFSWGPIMTWLKKNRMKQAQYFQNCWFPHCLSVCLKSSFCGMFLLCFSGLVKFCIGQNQSPNTLWHRTTDSLHPFCGRYSLTENCTSTYRTTDSLHPFCGQYSLTENCTSTYRTTDSLHPFCSRYSLTENCTSTYRTTDSLHPFCSRYSLTENCTSTYRTTDSLHPFCSWKKEDLLKSTNLSWLSHGSVPILTLLFVSTFSRNLDHDL